MKQLLVLVGERKEKVSRVFFKERSISDFLPFSMAMEIPNIEQFLWEYSCKMALHSASGILDIFKYLMLLNGFLRMKSLHLANLSDLCDFIFHQKNERDPYYCLILRKCTGNVNKNRTKFGRATRHVSTRLYLIVDLESYLNIRLIVIKEYEKFNFSDNSTWLNQKLLRAIP